MKIFKFKFPPLTMLKNGYPFKCIKNVYKNKIQYTIYMDIKELKCIICNKMYVSYKSLWNHNKKFHKIEDRSDVINVIQDNKNVIQNNKNVIQNNNNVFDENNQETNNISIKNSLKCEYCNKIFATRQSKSKHKKKACKNNKININNVNELEEIKKENIEIKNSLKELKELLLKNNKIHPKTLQKINKNLINNNINTTNNNNTNNINNTINNKKIINKTYINFYDPIDYKILNKKEKLNILSRL